MGRMLFNLSVLGVIATGWLSTGLCGPPPIRPVTTIYRSSSVVTTQWSPTGNSFAAEHLSSLASTDRTGPPGLLPDTEVHSSPQSNGFSLSPNGNNGFGDSNQSLRVGRIEFVDGAEIAPKNATLATIKTLLGTWVCLLLLLCNIAYYVSLLTDKQWGKVGIRVIASWIIAISLLVLAFALKKTQLKHS